MMSRVLIQIAPAGTDAEQLDRLKRQADAERHPPADIRRARAAVCRSDLSDSSIFEPLAADIRGRRDIPGCSRRKNRKFSI